ncbi:hypothetical protein J2X20_004314 [Pelomonas saccharophila]|uniref:PNPLA domain-containing protein n=1 Tax=Roseateles saccharophilus TaxID=304 RepID=A0ABU1YUL0_ROSSA|nr:hypothetical protein [Roseateles saccharophilus]MDR7271646.1 hypothetical protein [Roseateles saccharophilus]
MLIPVVYPPHEPKPPPTFSPPPPPPGSPEPSPPPPPEQPPAPPAPEGGDVPRMLYLLRALGLCAFPVGIVIAGVVVLLGLEQARETLLSLEVGSLQTALLVFAFGLWLLMAWYVSRLLLDRRFKPDTLGECTHAGFAERLRRWLPRGLVLGGGLPITTFFLMQARERLIGVGLLAMTLGLYLFVWKRRAWLLRLGSDSWLARILALNGRREAIAQMEREDRMSTPSRVLIVLVLLLQWALFAALVAWPEATARAIGSPALVLLAMGSWIVFGGVLLTYAPKALIRMPLTVLPLLLFIAFAPLNDNHRVADPERSAASAIAPRQPADAWLQTWLRTVGADGKRPLVLVAVAGGASRAAYWGSASMARLQDLGEQQGVNFADSVFAISGTSGGALGAASFVAAVDARRQAMDAANCTPWKLVRDFTGRDHLATPVGDMLYPDLVQRFLPVAIAGVDRSLGLEKVWAHDWPKSLATQCPLRPTAHPNPWSAPMTALHARSTDAEWLPLLALNTTALSRGQRVYQSDFLLPSGDGIDLLDPSIGLDVDRMTLAQAVHNSARFPYISPAGAVVFKEAHKDAENSDVGRVWDRLGDGGYVEASATLLLSDLLRDLEASGRLKLCKPEDDCARQGILDRSRLRLLLLANTPALVDDWLCRDAPTAADAQPLNGRRYRATHMGLNEVVAPGQGILNSNNARGRDSAVELIKRVGGCGQVAELRLPAVPGQRQPSMNWMLNSTSRELIDAALLEKLNPADPAVGAAQAQLVAHLRQAKGWMLQMK